MKENKAGKAAAVNKALMGIVLILLTAVFLLLFEKKIKQVTSEEDGSDKGYTEIAEAEKEYM